MYIYDLTDTITPDIIDYARHPNVLKMTIEE